VLLWGAAALAVIGGMPSLGVGIAVVVVLNGVFAFAQEHRADRMARSLAALVPRRTTVRRDGERRTVDADDLVPGDLVLLAAGDRFGADLRCRSATAAQMDLSTVTGESAPVGVRPGDLLPAGAHLVRGEAEGVVVATGASTGLAAVVRTTRRTVRPDTPLARELRSLVRIMTVVALGVGGVFFGVLLLLGAAPSDGFVFAIGVAVALVPEALLPTITLSLAVGARRMAGHHALVRRLEAVETLGSTTCICTDKTGTLTENRMNVVAVWTPAGTVTVTGPGYEPSATVAATEPAALTTARCLAAGAASCTAGTTRQVGAVWEPVGDPVDAAVRTLAHRLDAATPGPSVPGPTDLDGADVVRTPFDPARRWAAASSGMQVAVLGAPDTVLAAFPRGPVHTAAEAALERFSTEGRRVLAVATGTTRRAGSSAHLDRLDDVAFEAIGLFALEDPPRPRAAAAIAACRRAGIRIVMVTGDHPRTALAVAREVGLHRPGAPVLVEADLPDDDEALGAAIDHDGAVLARITPVGKLRVARVLRARGHVLAMTGDGVNDGPALREADIGVAMGASGTDVAREAADVVLLDDDFATIVEAVRHGRATFANARRFLTYHLTDNVAELTPLVVHAVSGGRFPLALGVLQILAIDLGTDTLAAAALGAEPPRPHVLERPPVSGRLLDRTVALRAFGLLGPLEGVAEMVVFCAALVAVGWWPGDAFPTGGALAAASGAAFLTVVAAQGANGFACRSTTRSSVTDVWQVNRLLLAGVAVDVAVGIAAVVVGPLARTLGHAPPPWVTWPAIVAAAPLLWVADALAKRSLLSRAADRRRRRGSPSGRAPQPPPG